MDLREMIENAYRVWLYASAASCMLVVIFGGLMWRARRDVPAIDC